MCAAEGDCQRVGLIGLPFPGVELKMVPCGSKYELRLRGVNVTPGYFGQPELTVPMRWIALAVVPMTFVWILSASLRAMLRIRDAQLIQFVLVPGVAALGLALLARAGHGDVRGAVWAFAFANAVAVTAGLVLWRRAAAQTAGVTGDSTRGPCCAPGGRCSACRR